jgi:cold shock CspA family protein
MFTATVLSFDRTRGFGWAIPDDGGNDIFIHRSSLPPVRRYLNENDRIAYEIGDYNGKPCAVAVRYLGHTVAAQRSAARLK